MSLTSQARVALGFENGSSHRHAQCLREGRAVDADVGVAGHVSAVPVGYCLALYFRRICVTMVSRLTMEGRSGLRIRKQFT